tara:strand:+ start:81 stop:1070 length:990 start_codon:yes stop_codon:yes gene_type:complete
MKLVYFAFRHRYRFKDLNNFLYSRVYGKYFLLNLGGPIKHIFAKILLKLKIGIPISLDARPLLENNSNGINFFIRGTSLNIPKNFLHLDNNVVSIQHPILDNNDIFQIYPIDIKKTRIKKKPQIIYMSSINIETTDEEKKFWEKFKNTILSDFTTIDNFNFWKINLPHTDKDIINQFYRKIKLLLRFEIISYLKEKYKDNFKIVGSDWSKLSIKSEVSNYDIKKNNKLYRGNICLDLGCIEGSSSLYSRANQIIESGGLIIQTNQMDYKDKWKNLSKKILFKNFRDLDLIINKVINDYDYANKLINEVHNNFLNTKKFMEDSLDKILDK